MNKEETERIILETVDACDGFVCGGYVRDKVVLNKGYKDMDIFIPTEAPFIPLLASRAKVIVLPTLKLTDNKLHLENNDVVEKSDLLLYTANKYLVNNVVVDLLWGIPDLTTWDFNINCLTLEKGKINNLFEEGSKYWVEDIGSYAKLRCYDYAHTILSITSSIVSKQAIALKPLDTISPWRIKKFKLAGYTLIEPSYRSLSKPRSF